MLALDVAVRSGGRVSFWDFADDALLGGEERNPGDDPVADVELANLAAVLGVIEGAVGKHPVHLQGQHPDPPQPLADVACPAHGPLPSIPDSYIQAPVPMTCKPCQGGAIRASLFMAI